MRRVFGDQRAADGTFLPTRGKVFFNSTSAKKRCRSEPRVAFHRPLYARRNWIPPLGRVLAKTPDPLLCAFFAFFWSCLDSNSQSFVLPGVGRGLRIAPPPLASIRPDRRRWLSPPALSPLLPRRWPPHTSAGVGVESAATQCVGSMAKGWVASATRMGDDAPAQSSGICDHHHAVPRERMPRPSPPPSSGAPFRWKARPRSFLHTPPPHVPRPSPLLCPSSLFGRAPTLPSDPFVVHFHSRSGRAIPEGHHRAHTPPGSRPPKASWPSSLYSPSLQGNSLAAPLTPAQSAFAT